MDQKKLPITGLPVGGVSPNVLVCGDPDRATKIAAVLDDATIVADQREYRSYNGFYRGTPVTVCSHGIGAPGAGIAFEELILAGARHIIRVGTCGGLQPDVRDGDLVIAVAAVQNTGYVNEIAPRGFPSVADPFLTITLYRAAQASEFQVHTGLVLTRDAFYGGVKAPRQPDYATMSEANVLAVEMECAALFTVGALRKVRTAAILAVDGNVLDAAESADSYRPDRDIVARAVAGEIAIAAQALASSADTLP
jgi:uridine phosphorylase